MAGFFNSRVLTKIAFGTRNITHVYHGSRLVWQQLQPHDFFTNVWVGPMTRSAWTTLHTHKVVGSGRANLRSEWLFNFTALYMAEHLRAIRILRNGVQIGYWDHGGNRVMAQVWDSWGTLNNRELVDGDDLVLQAYVSSSNNDLRTISRYSLRVTPI